MVKTDQLEETIDSFKKQTKRFSDGTRECVTNIDNDITILWDKVMGIGDEKSLTNRVADLTEVDGGDQSLSSSDDLVIAHSIPIDQSGQHLNSLSSNIVGKNTVKGGCLEQGDKKKDK